MFIWSVCYWRPILTKLESERQISIKFPNIKFHENTASGSRVVPRDQTTTSVVAFHNFCGARLKIFYRVCFDQVQPFTPAMSRYKEVRLRKKRMILPVFLHSEIPVLPFSYYMWKWWNEGRERASSRAVSDRVLDVHTSSVPLAGKRCSGWPPCRAHFTLARSLLRSICILIESGNKERLKSLSTIIRSNGDAGHKLWGKWLPLF
jgi:hypothetical protein